MPTALYSLPVFVFSPGLFLVSGFQPTPCRFGCLYLRAISCMTSCPLLLKTSAFRTLHLRLASFTFAPGPSLSEPLQVVTRRPMSRGINANLGQCNNVIGRPKIVPVHFSCHYVEYECKTFVYVTLQSQTVIHVLVIQVSLLLFPPPVFYKNKMCTHWPSCSYLYI